MSQPSHNPSRLHPLDGASALGFVAYSSSATVTPVCLLAICRELSLSLGAAGGIEAVRGALIVCSLLASGVLAARFGKAIALGLSCVLVAIGMVLYGIAPTYGLILLATGMAGVGAGVIEALINPLVQDLHPGNSGKFLNAINGFWSIGVLLTVLVSGYWLTAGHSWRPLIIGTGIMSLLAGIGFLAFASKGPANTRHSLRDVLGHKAEILRARNFWWFAGMMFCGGGAEGAYTFWTASYIQLHYGSTALLGGIGTAFFAGGMILGRFASSLWISQHRLPTLISVSAGFGVAVSLGLPFSGSITMVFMALFLAGTSVACFWPSIQSYAADCLPLETTSLFILLSCAGIPGFAFASWLLGWISDGWGIQSAVRVIPAFYLGLLLFLWIQRSQIPGIEKEG